MLTEHEDECSENVWLDRDEQLLIPPKELARRGCRACGYFVNLWSTIRKNVGDVYYGEIVFEALDLLEQMEYDDDIFETITSEDWEFVLAVKHAEKKFKTDQELKQQEEMKRKSQQSSRGIPR